MINPCTKAARTVRDLVLFLQTVGFNRLLDCKIPRLSGYNDLQVVAGFPGTDILLFKAPASFPSDYVLLKSRLEK